MLHAFFSGKAEKGGPFYGVAPRIYGDAPRNYGNAPRIYGKHPRKEGVSDRFSRTVRPTTCVWVSRRFSVG